MVDAELPPIAVLGAGSMGGAIAEGLVASAAADVRAVNRSEARAAPLRELGITSYALEREPDAVERAVAGAKLVILGVKPAGVPELLRSLDGLLDADAVVVSIAAGVTTATMEELTPNPVVRTMPNTPALVGRGVTGIAAGTRATASNLALVSRAFERVGRVVVLPESSIDALSAISGSGPAYVYLLVEALTEAAMRLGFTASEARDLAEGTFVGAGALLEASGEAPAQLRRRVTSPKGTTERAIAVLEGADLPGLFERAARAAIARAGELARGA